MAQKRGAPASVKVPSVPDFSDEIVDTIVSFLPEPLTEARSELLPPVLHEWSRSDLRKHLSWESREAKRGRIKRQEKVCETALKFLEALRALDEEDRIQICGQMIDAEGLRPEEVSRSNWTNRRTRLDDETSFLSNLVQIKPEQFWSLGRGQPRNYAAYLVLQDAANIFEWFSGLNPTREVDRDTLKETGPFFRFASALWPTIFGNGTVGLPAAMKNWAYARKHYHERSALIANMALRHPKWGLFQD